MPVICLPGVPRELHAIFDAHLEARLAELREARGAVERIARRIYRVFGRGESQISQACRGLVDGVAGASIHYQVKFPETLVKLVVRDRDRGAPPTRRLDALDARLRERLAGHRLRHRRARPSSSEVTRRLIAGGRTIATAESCTGGMIGELLTRMPGSSRGVQRRRDRLLERREGPPARRRARRRSTRTARSARRPCVEMARGARERFGVDLAVAVSGIAGPDGGTPDKPVGTVWLALADRGRTGSRDRRRRRSSSGRARAIRSARSPRGGRSSSSTRRSTGVEGRERP